MDDSIRRIIESAAHAPSGDNTQPWYFTVDGNKLRIHLIPELDNPILNYRLSGTYIAHGALIENIIQAAPLYGRNVETSFLPDAKDPYCTAEILFSETNAKPSRLAAYIAERHTNRKPYKKEPITPSELDALSATGSKDQAIKVSFTSDRSKINQAAYAAALMEQVALETPPLRDLFFADILWSEEQNMAGIPGLYIRTMELPAPVRVIFRRMLRPSFAKFMNAIGFSKAARATNAKLYGTAPLFALVSFKEETPLAYLNVGRTFERIWLEATALGLAVQPVTGLSFLARSLRGGENVQLLSQHSLKIYEADDTIRSVFGLTNEEIPGMMVRIGHAAPATCRSFRHAPDIR
jgi:nitroreductase